MDVMDLNEKYNRKTRFLHWLSAVVILWVTISGFAVTLLEVEAKIKSSVLALNVLINTFYIPFFIFRVVNILSTPTPDYPQGVSIRSRTLAKIAHTSIYFLTFVVLVSGVLMMDRKVEFLGMTLIPYLPFDLALKDIFVQLHIFSVCILAVLVLLHIAAVVKHEVSDLKVVRRMLG